MMVRATLNYLRDTHGINRRFVAPGAEFNTGVYVPHQIEIADARALAAPPTLASHGFTLLHHVSAVLDFDDAAEVEARYPAEADALIRAVTGAALVLQFGWMLRSSVVAPDTQPPAADVHVDLTPERAARFSALLLAKAGETRTPTRTLITSLWRAFSPPPQDWPLALCDGTSVGDSEGVPNVMVRVDTLPDGDAAFAPLADEAALPAASVFPYSPDHRWYYYPDMTRDEAVLLAFNDSAHGPAWRVPHTAFADSSVAAAIPRRSIELRSAAFWFD